MPLMVMGKPKIKLSTLKLLFKQEAGLKKKVLGISSFLYYVRIVKREFFLVWMYTVWKSLEKLPYITRHYFHFFNIRYNQTCREKIWQNHN